MLSVSVRGVMVRRKFKKYSSDTISQIHELIQFLISYRGLDPSIDPDLVSNSNNRCSCRIEVQTISWFHRVKLSWNCHEIVMKLSSSWNCRAIVMKLSWNCHEIVVILSSYSPIIILSSNCREMVIIFSCRSSYCHEIVIKWTSNCPQNFQAQLTDI